MDVDVAVDVDAAVIETIIRMEHNTMPLLRPHLHHMATIFPRHLEQFPLRWYLEFQIAANRHSPTPPSTSIIGTCVSVVVGMFPFGTLAKRVTTNAMAIKMVVIGKTLKRILRQATVLASEACIRRSYHPIRNHIRLDG